MKNHIENAERISAHVQDSRGITQHILNHFSSIL